MTEAEGVGIIANTALPLVEIPTTALEQPGRL